MELSVDQTLSAAITFHRNGEILQAKRFYQAVLSEAPTQPVANHNLALVFIQEGRSKESLFHFKVSTDSDPTIEQHWRSFFTALMELRQFSDAGALILSMERHAEMRDAVLEMRSALTASLCRLEPAEKDEGHSAILPTERAAHASPTPMIMCAEASTMC